MVTKQRVIMSHFFRANVEDVLFCEWQDGGPIRRQRQLSLLSSDWAEMGSPEVITVTIEPGDLLNDDAS